MHTPRHAAMSALPEAAPPWRSVADLNTVLDSVVHSIGELAPEAHVGITVNGNGGIFETLSGTDPLVFVLDDMQYELDEGPCLTAIREGRTVTVEDAEREQRWPRFMSRATDLGVSSQAGLPLFFDSKTLGGDKKALGGLSMYSTAHMCMDADRLACANAVAAQASIALQQALREEVLFQALTTSRTMGKAIGMVMERFGLDEEAAFQHLVDMSQNSNAKLRDVARMMVSQCNQVHRCSDT